MRLDDTHPLIRERDTFEPTAPRWTRDPFAQSVERALRDVAELSVRLVGALPSPTAKEPISVDGQNEEHEPLGIERVESLHDASESDRRFVTPARFAPPRTARVGNSNLLA